MNDKFTDREKGFEKKFAKDEELQFKVQARSNKYLAEFVCAKLNIPDEEKQNYVQESTNFAGVYIRRGKKRTSVFYISYRLRGKQQMDRLGTISEGWTAEVAAVERTRRKDGLQPNSDPPPTPEFRNSDDTASQLLHLKAKSAKEPSISELFEKYISQKKLEKGSRGFSYEQVMRF